MGSRTRMLSQLLFDGKSAHEIARLLPAQDAWREEEYLALETNRLVELSQGRIEVLPVPTTSHQLLLFYLYGLLATFAGRGLGTVLGPGARVRLWPGKIREPDVVFMHKRHAERIGDECWEGADLVMEVVSGGARDRWRDLKEKRREYTRAGIPEYWIIDPRKEQITVLRLDGEEYAVHGEYAEGTTAASHLLPGFEVDVTTAFAQRLPAKPKPRRRPGGRRNEKDKE